MAPQEKKGGNHRKKGGPLSTKTLIFSGTQAIVGEENGEASSDLPHRAKTLLRCSAREKRRKRKMVKGKARLVGRGRGGIIIAECGQK